MTSYKYLSYLSQRSLSSLRDWQRVKHQKRKPMNNIVEYPITFIGLCILYVQAVYILKHKNYGANNIISFDELVSNNIYGFVWFFFFFSDLPAFWYRFDAYFLHPVKIKEFLLSLTWWDRWGKYIAYLLLKLVSDRFLLGKHKVWVKHVFGYAVN